MTGLSQAYATAFYILQLTPCSDIYATALRCIKHCCNAVVEQLPEFLPDKLLCQMPGESICALDVLLAGFLCNRSRSVARAVSGLSACLSRRLLHVDLISPACTSGIWAFRGMWYWQHMQRNAAGLVKSYLNLLCRMLCSPDSQCLNCLFQLVYGNLLLTALEQHGRDGTHIQTLQSHKSPSIAAVNFLDQP